MLDDQLLRERYAGYLDRSIELAAREIERNRQDERLRTLSEYYHARFSNTRHQFISDWNGDILEAFRQLRREGYLEIAATAATHGLLPLLQQPSDTARAQVLIGCDAYRATFDADPAGFWLPECAYAPGLDEILQAANLRWFILDAHGLMFGQPRPRHAIYSPCYTSAGPAAFARDRDCSRQIWSATEGYPGDPAYRDFYRDIGFDRPLDYLHSGTQIFPGQRFTGLKYHRVTGGNVEKELYDPALAETVADGHADHFLKARREQMDELCALGFDPIVLAPFDAELFGHWWFEGPRFLESFIRQVGTDDQDLRLIKVRESSPPRLQLTTPTEFLAHHPTQQIISPAASSWGENGYFAVWLNEANAWIYPHLHSAAGRMTELTRDHATDETATTDRVLKQLARELLLAQSSDWAFLMKTDTAKQYAIKRLTSHILRFNRLYDQFVSGTVDEDFLADCEGHDNLFPKVNWRHYIPC
jgi:1,4-alpha-glucan branching enzyme